MTSHPTPPRRPARGVSLIELMIGMAIGLLAVLVMTQVTVVFEGRKRSTTSGSDAQVNGALALQTLQRDIQMAGYGMTSGGAAGCTLRGQFFARCKPVPPWDNSAAGGRSHHPGRQRCTRQPGRVDEQPARLSRCR